MTVWLTGCNGMLGQAFAERFTNSDVAFIGTDLDVDLTSSAAIEDFCRSRSFTHIVNAAAYTKVDDAEREFDKAFAVNGTAVRLLCEQAHRQSATLVHFSTDYVFSGVAGEPYVEEAPKGPISAYGKSKLEGERWVQSQLSTGAYLIRTSWLFGPGGANFVRAILDALMTRKEVRVVHDQHGRPTYTSDLARAAMALAGLAAREPAPTGCYHFANSGETSWHEFALAIAESARKHGLRLTAEAIVPISSDELKRPAPRPAYSVLDTAKFETALQEAPRDFRLALDEYVGILAKGIVQP